MSWSLVRWSIACSLVAIEGVSSQLTAQGVPGSNVLVQLRSTSATINLGVSTIVFEAAVDIRSPEPLFTLTIDAPSPPTRLPRPGPASEWSVATVHRGRSVAAWAALTNVVPGRSTPPLTFSAPGLPGIDTVWVQGQYPTPFLDDDAMKESPPPAPSDPLRTASVVLMVVGIDPLPADTSPEFLLRRLDDLTVEACALSWITSASFCTSLRSYLASNVPDLSAFVGALDVGHVNNGVVGDNAYWLLTSNAGYIAALSPSRRKRS